MFDTECNLPARGGSAFGGNAKTLGVEHFRDHARSACARLFKNSGLRFLMRFLWFAFDVCKDRARAGTVLALACV